MRERIPSRLGDDPLQHRLVEARREHGLEQGARIAAAERLDPELREARESAARVTRRECEHDPLREQSASDERERSRRGAVEPLRVVDHAEQRLLLGRLREQAENGKADEERARRAARR